MTAPRPPAARPPGGGREPVCRGRFRTAVGCAVVFTLAFSGAAAAADWPAMRFGVWLITRKAPVDPIYALDKPITSTTELCAEQAGDLFVDPNNRLLDLCNFTALERHGDTYTASSDCTIPMWRAKLNTRRVTKVSGEVGYHTKFETDGTVNGKHVHWTETITAKWIGDCPDGDTGETTDNGKGGS